MARQREAEPEKSLSAVTSIEAFQIGLLEVTCVFTHREKDELAYQPGGMYFPDLLITRSGLPGRGYGEVLALSLHGYEELERVQRSAYTGLGASWEHRPVIDWVESGQIYVSPAPNENCLEANNTFTLSAPWILLEVAQALFSSLDEHPNFMDNITKISLDEASRPSSLRQFKIIQPSVSLVYARFRQGAARLISLGEIAAYGEKGTRATTPPEASIKSINKLTEPLPINQGGPSGVLQGYQIDRFHNHLVIASPELLAANQPLPPLSKLKKHEFTSAEGMGFIATIKNL